MVKAFVTISNREIYDELCTLKRNNEDEHQKIMGLISGYKSQVSRLKWALGGAFTLTLLTLGWFVSHLS
jgi:hypothetical protein